MFNLRCAITSASAVCRQLSFSLNVSESTRWAPSVIHRTLFTSALRLEEVATSTTETGLENNSKFSFIPPLPGEDSPLRWGGKKFEELHVVHVKATYNNIHVQLTNSAGASLVRTSGGTEGFKNRKKSTQVAAQAAAVSAAAKATAKGVTFVRVVLKGIGPGRVHALKGLTMGGLEVVSITDNTPVPHNGCRPCKARRT